MTTWGADPEALDQLAAQIGIWAGALAQHRVNLGAHIYSAPWRGTEADSFRQEWNSRLSPALAAVSEALLRAQKILRHNAEQQRQASGVGVGSPGAGRVTGGRTSVLETVLGRVGTILTIGTNLGLATELFVERNMGGAIKDLRTLKKEALRFEHDVPAPLDRALRVLQVGTIWHDSSQVMEELVRGEISAKDVATLAWDAGNLIPVVGEVKGAWDLGYDTGTWIAHHTPVVDKSWDLVTTVHPNIYTDPKAADDLVKRYSGWSGMLHWGDDVGKGMAAKSSSWLARHL